MALAIRTDLAEEAHALWREGAGETTRLPGVRARDEETEGFPVTRVEILDEEGETALGKPRGIYLTLDITAFWRREEDAFARVVRAVGELLSPLLPEEGVSLTDYAAAGAAMAATFSPAAALAFLVFCALYTPCVAAIATIRREMGSRSWTALTLVWQLGVAWLASFAAYRLAVLFL